MFVSRSRATSGETVSGCSGLLACFQGEYEAPALLEEAELLFAGQPANTHEQEALRKRRPVLELVERHRPMLRQIPPHLARCLADLCVHPLVPLPCAVPVSRCTASGVACLRGGVLCAPHPGAPSPGAMTGEGVGLLAFQPHEAAPIGGEGEPDLHLRRR